MLAGADEFERAPAFAGRERSLRFSWRSVKTGDIFSPVVLLAESPERSRAFRLDIGASNPSSSRATGVYGACLARNSIVGWSAMISSLVALNT